MRGLARIYDVRMAQFVLKIEKLSHIMGPRAAQDLRSPSPIMAPAQYLMSLGYVNKIKTDAAIFLVPKILRLPLQPVVKMTSP